MRRLSEQLSCPWRFNEDSLRGGARMSLPAAVHGVRVTNHPVSDKRQARLPAPVKTVACLRLSDLALRRT